MATSTLAGLPTNTTSHSQIPSPSHTHHRHRPGGHIGELVDESISHLVPYSALILTICAILVFVVRLYVIEKWLMNTRRYKDKYEILPEEQKRSFINHHVAGTLKIILFFTAIYPFSSIAFGYATPHTPFVHGTRVTMGDVMIICSNLFTVMYIFELFYRVDISPISALHHVAAVVIAQTALAISLNFEDEVDAVYEFFLCFVWGAFDVLAELWPHLAIITYRLLPLSNNTPVGELSVQRAAHNHILISRVFLFTSYVELGGTLLETVLVFWLFGLIWPKWKIVFKIITPILHVLFSCAQLWGSWIFRQLSIQEAKRGKALLEQAQEGAEVESVCETKEDEYEEPSEIIMPRALHAEIIQAEYGGTRRVKSTPITTIEET